jgi:hypothetical protein
MGDSRQKPHAYRDFDSSLIQDGGTGEAESIAKRLCLNARRNSQSGDQTESLTIHLSDVPSAGVKRIEEGRGRRIARFFQSLMHLGICCPSMPLPGLAGNYLEEDVDWLTARPS